MYPLVPTIQAEPQIEFLASCIKRFMADLEEKSDVLNSEKMRELAGLWVQAQPALSAYINSLVHDFHRTQDLLQEVAEAVATHFDKYDPNRPFLTWALGIARRRVMRYYRAQSRERCVFSQDAMMFIAEAMERVEPEIELRRVALKKCIEEVDGQRKRVLEMRYQAGLSVAEIARRVGSSGTAVRSMLHRARRSLATCVNRRLALEEAP